MLKQELVHLDTAVAGKTNVAQHRKDVHQCHGLCQRYAVRAVQDERSHCYTQQQQQHHDEQARGGVDAEALVDDVRADPAVQVLQDRDSGDGRQIHLHPPDVQGQLLPGGQHPACVYRELPAELVSVLLLRAFYLLVRPRVGEASAILGVLLHELEVLLSSTPRPADFWRAHQEEEDPDLVEAVLEVRHLLSQIIAERVRRISDGSSGGEVHDQRPCAPPSLEDGVQRVRHLHGHQPHDRHVVHHSQRLRVGLVVLGAHEHGVQGAGVGRAGQGCEDVAEGEVLGVGEVRAVVHLCLHLLDGVVAGSQQVLVRHIVAEPREGPPGEEDDEKGRLPSVYILEDSARGPVQHGGPREPPHQGQPEQAEQAVRDVDILVALQDVPQADDRQQEVRGDHQ
mmetsp:Transcript_91644/g.268205  ORF Transcript_91644/g.268205 Transcript_91644/m.268205 type:complete len:396 (+) Transcript_91644:415-1602(+)